MSKKEYPAEIYMHGKGAFPNVLIGVGSPIGDMAENAYDLGKKHALADTGDWHNLTKAIADGEPIDFEKLDGRKVRMSCETTSIEATLSRDDEFLPWGTNAWSLTNDNDVNHLWGFFSEAWHGRYGWALWLDGEIPMRKQTAFALHAGTKFYAENNTTYIRTTTGVLNLQNYKHQITGIEELEVHHIIEGA